MTWLYDVIQEETAGDDNRIRAVLIGGEWHDVARDENHDALFFLHGEDENSWCVFHAGASVNHGTVIYCPLSAIQAVKTIP